MLFQQKASCSLILIASMPCLLLLVSFLGAHIYLLKQKRKTEHLCYVKVLKLNSHFANFLNYTKHQHNPKVIRLKKKKKFYQNTLKASLHPGTIAALKAKILYINTQLKILQADWELKKISYRTKFLAESTKPLEILHSQKERQTQNTSLLENNIIQSIHFDYAHTYNLNTYLIERIKSSISINLKIPFLFESQFPEEIQVQCHGGIRFWKKRWLSQII